MFPLRLPLDFVFFFVWHQHLEPSLDIVNESNLGSFFYETVYDVVFAVDYSKEILDVGVVNPHPNKSSDNRCLCHHSWT